MRKNSAMLGAKAFLDAGLRALYLDFESNDVLFVQRARQVGIPDGFIRVSLGIEDADDLIADFEHALAS